ncbi:MAG TPA: GNAT family N-acyltransferase [Verrucomicrobiae bacterium]|nr:GNAT family N-acyltransferase [Verrucomicrobiae bacterium]
MPPGSDSIHASSSVPEQAQSSKALLPSFFQSLFTSQLNELYSKVRLTEDRPILETLMASMRVEFAVGPADVARIPATGPVVAICNHPFGILDGAILITLLLKVRPDVKILANYFLHAIPELASHCIFVDPFGRGETKTTNSRGLRQAISHLKTGGLLLVFPAGEVSHWQFRYAQVADPEWNETTARLIRITGATTVPFLCMGRNSVPFHLLGMIHPLLRTTRLPWELLNKAGKQFEVRVGSPIPARKIENISLDTEATRFLRWRTYLLASRGEAATQTVMNLGAPILLKKVPEPVAPEVEKPAIVAEMSALHSAGKALDENREFAVYSAGADQIPDSLKEIGRLREMAFREVGEGTGRGRDLDRFDAYYTHLVLWDKAKQEIAGAYRVANTQEVLRDKGVQGLYTSTLFTFAPKFFQAIGPAAELGRSFVRSEYQKQYAPLLMLWKGLARYAVLQARVPVLFGAVSVSSSYNRASRELLVGYFRSRASDPLAKLVRPKRSFRPRMLRDWELSAVQHLLDLEELGTSIADMEEDRKGVPILLRQYLRMGGSILAFNVDRKFSNVLDGLIMVDLRQTGPARLKPYMTGECWDAYLRIAKASSPLELPVSI